MLIDGCDPSQHWPPYSMGILHIIDFWRNFWFTFYSVGHHRLYRNPSSIYSCSIDHILEHGFCHLGCWAVLQAVSEKFLKRRNFSLSMLLFGVVFSCFQGQKNNFMIHFLHFSNAFKSYIKWVLYIFFFLKKFEKVEKIGYHSRFFVRKSWV